MINQEDTSKKLTRTVCPCTNTHGLFVPNRLLSTLVSCLLFIFFASFVAGYFLGKRREIQQITDTLRDTAFEDDMLMSATPTCEDQPNAIELDTVTSFPETLPEQVIQKESTITEKYRAQLIGFGTERAAQQFAQKLTLKGIEVEVVTRSSKTAKGRAMSWYQVVTADFEDKDALVTLVDRLTKEEKLKDVRVLSSSKINNI